MLITFAPAKPSCSKGKPSNTGFHSRIDAIDYSDYNRHRRNGGDRGVWRCLF